MRSIFVQIFLIFILVLVIPGQDNIKCEFGPEQAWKDYGFNGRVKSAVTYKVDHLPRFGKHYIGEKEVYGKILFDAEGNITSDGVLTEYIDWTPRMISNKPDDPFSPVCDSQNRIVRGEILQAPGNTVKRTTIQNNKQGIINERSEFSPDGKLISKVVYTYDPKGNLKETTTSSQVHPEHFSPKRYDVYVTTSVEYKYDDRYNLIEKISYRAKKVLYAIWKYSFDQKDRLMKELRIDDKGRSVDMTIYKYESDNLVEKIEYQNFCYTKENAFCDGGIKTPEGDFYYVTKAAYEYDSTGNWIRRIEYYKGGEQKLPEYAIAAVYDRVIVYY